MSVCWKMWAYNSSNFTNDYIFGFYQNNMIHALRNYRVIMQWRDVYNTVHNY